MADGAVAIEVAEVAVVQRAGVHHQHVAGGERAAPGRRDDVIVTAGRGCAHQVRDVVGAALEQRDLEGAEDLDQRLPRAHQAGHGIEGVRGDRADVRDLGDLRLRLDHAQITHQVGRIDPGRAGQRIAHARMVGQRHAQHGLRPHRQADATAARADLAQRLDHQRDPLVVGPRRLPAADVVDPGARHQRSADARHDGDRLAVARHDQEPGPRRALPELGQEAGEIADLGLGRQQQRVDAGIRHRALRARQSLLELGGLEPAWRLAAAHRPSRARASRVQ